MTEGWGWPGLAKKAHYFVGATSLCGKWMYTGKLETAGVGVPATSPDDCASCARKAAKRKVPSK